MARKEKPIRQDQVDRVAAALRSKNEAQRTAGYRPGDTTPGLRRAQALLDAAIRNANGLEITAALKEAK